MKWWKSQPEAWKEVAADALSPEVVMKELCNWIDSLKAKPIFVAHPIGFDYVFVSWYLHKFAQNPFEDHSVVTRILDLPSFAAGRLTVPLSKSARPQLPDPLKIGLSEHSHKAIDDARGCGVILRNLLKA